MKSFAILPFVAAVFAAPSVEKRSCQNFYYPDLWTLSSANPDAGAASVKSPFTVAQDAKGKTDLLASFRYLPGGIYGCTLQYYYVPGANAQVTKTLRDATKFDVYRVSDGGNFPYNPTWTNTAPRTGNLVGTWTFPTDLTKPATININSFSCDSILDFRFTVEDPYALGGVTAAETQSSGLRIQYNC